MVTKNQAIEMAKKLTKDGIAQREISAKLHEAGYATASGKALGQTGVSHLLRTAKRAPAPTRASRSRVDAIKSILKLKGMEASEKIALALLVID